MRDDEAQWEQFRMRYQERYREFKTKQMDRLNAVTQEWEREKEEQRALGDAIALLSPAAALTFMISDAAGTGDLAYQQYKEAVATQYQMWIERFLAGRKAIVSASEREG